MNTLIQKTKVSSQELKQNLPLKDFTLIRKEGRVKKSDLVYCEASIAVLEGLVKHFEDCLDQRSSTEARQTSHFETVEKKIDELLLLNYRYYKSKLRATKRIWGNRPYEDYIHEGSE